MSVNLLGTYITNVDSIQPSYHYTIKGFTNVPILHAIRLYFSKRLSLFS